MYRWSGVVTIPQILYFEVCNEKGWEGEWLAIQLIKTE